MKPPDDPNAPGGPTPPEADESLTGEATAKVLPIRKGQAKAATAAADWQQALRRNESGNYTRDPGNAALLLTNHADWLGCLQYDEFADRIYWQRQPPPMPGLTTPAVGDLLADHHIIFAQHWLARMQNVSFGVEATHSALVSASRHNTHHPVRDYLTSLKHDGRLRLHNWLQTYLGSPDDEYLHHVGRLWMISAVARVMRPGCQADYMLVFEGKQGVGKSTAVRILAGDWYLGSVPDLQHKDSSAALRGKWIAEFAELDAMHRAELTRVKEYLTRIEDSYRPAYGRNTIDQPRQTVFAGTTNDQHWNKDDSGEARRFWPVPVTQLDRDALTADRDQLWAEAFGAFVAGDQWHPSPELLPALREAQEERAFTDEWTGRIAKWLSDEPISLSAGGVTIAEVLAGALSVPPKDQDKAVQTRVGQIISRLGLKPQRVREHGARIRRYVKVC